MSTKTASKSAESKSSESKAAEPKGEASTGATEQVQTAAPKAQSKDFDSVLTALLDPNRTSVMVEEIDQRIAARRAELEQLETARARLAGAPAGQPTAPRQSRGPRKQAAAKEAGGSRENGAEHAGWIVKAVAALKNPSKAQIAAELETLGHPMDSGTLSTYLNLMGKRGQLIPTKQSAKRSTYAVNKKYTGNAAG